MVIVITGANSGLGYSATLHEAAQGHTIIMAIRNMDKGTAARNRILAQVPQADLRLIPLDLASLHSVQVFAERVAQQFDHIDVLCNNAGIMVPPFGRTAEGFEIQIGTNFLGHYALTCRLMPLLCRASSARIITLSSVAKWFGTIRTNTFRGQKRYHPWLYYAQSKYADYLFFKLLQDKLEHAGIRHVISLGCHPGIAKTNLTARGTGQHDKTLDRLWNLVGQSGEAGAATLIYAIDTPGLHGRDYIVPNGFMQFKGHPKVGHHLCTRYNRTTAKRLWTTAEELTGLRLL